MPFIFNEKTNNWEPGSTKDISPALLLSRSTPRISSARSIRKVNQAQAAKMIDVTPNTLRNYESGASQITNYDLIKLALMLEFDPRALMKLPPFDDGNDIDDLNEASLIPSKMGNWWPAGHELPKAVRMFYIFSYTANLTLIVIKKPTSKQRVDPTDVRYLLPCNASRAFYEVERLLREDTDYLVENGFDVEAEDIDGIKIEWKSLEGNQ